jgi:hypothetical protein
MTIEQTRNVGKSAVGLCVTLLCCCGVAQAQDVKYNVMPGTNFAKYHTYKWANCGGNHPGQIVNQEIIQDVDAQLSLKGFTQASGDADMLVCYQVAIDKERAWNAMSMGGARFGGMGTATSSTISNGTMILDFYDATAKQQIWQGTATKTLDPSGNEQKNQKNLAKGVEKLMKNFPPKIK